MRGSMRGYVRKYERDVAIISACVIGVVCFFGQVAIARDAPKQCASFEQPQMLGTVTNSKINEASGIVASRQYPGVFWTHNDSGDAPLLYAIDATGKYLGQWRVDAAQASDWEDLAYGRCTQNADQFCLYIGDFGNNSKQRQDLAVYKVQEPSVDINAPMPADATTAKAERFAFRYPTSIGNHDAETLMVAPDGQLFVMTKGSPTHLVKLPTDINNEQEATLLASYDGLSTLTGGDLSADGGMLVVRNYLRAWVYQVQDVNALTDALSVSPTIIRLRAEPQGEAITFDAQNNLITLSEKTNQPLWQYRCVPRVEEMTNDMQPDMVEDMTNDMHQASDQTDDMPDLTILPPSQDDGQDNSGGCAQTPSNTPIHMGLMALVMGLFCRLNRGGSWRIK